jgi:hypothetical protein
VPLCVGDVRESRADGENNVKDRIPARWKNHGSAALHRIMVNSDLILEVGWYDWKRRLDCLEVAPNQNGGQGL